MSPSQRHTRLRQALWIASGVAVLTVVVLFLSWISKGDPAKDPELAPAAPVPTAQVERPTFEPESPNPVEEPGAAAPETEAPPIQVEDLGGPAASPPQAASGPAPAAESPAPPVRPEPAAAQPPKPLPPTAPPASAAKGFGVQVGAFGAPQTATEMQSKLQRLGYTVALLPKANLTRVVVTGFPDRAAAEAGMAKLKAQGIPQAQVVPLD